MTTGAVQPIMVEEPTIDKGILLLYVIIVGALAAALMYSLSLGKDYQSFSGSIITALTTIAGFAVGANTGQSRQ